MMRKNDNKAFADNSRGQTCVMAGTTVGDGQEC